jgi:hypothetical protein
MLDLPQSLQQHCCLLSAWSIGKLRHDAQTLTDMVKFS